MTLPTALTVPSLDPQDVARVRQLCDAIVDSARMGLDPSFLVESFNETTANDFGADELIQAAARLGTETVARLAISPPAPRVQADVAQWALVIERIRTGAATQFERAWWLELIERSSPCDDAVDRVLTDDGDDCSAVAAALFA